MTKKEKNPSFEFSLDRLESLVNQMESGEATLEQSLEWFEEGMGLINSCQNQLKEAEQKVQSLIKNNDGSFILKDSE
ncbi:MAG: exodeoxyribonuclease VII small subunit [Candidatus Marinimicrobia bacterium]|jgi:exodeoxyribonuclease VII small subunit|nr:exodeoxyribonuclease VII small subunit [Candidatus Neomarinimicrobiota bacterium]MBT3501871.1 exodeoxyribonuclease VII small subunit [Candidatus Neomarinimicrobiota bacterium]MBT3838603.1 exodeoxyribonuclease VII small subunit [Candidatus Neomarinimicrobiota bacterium]MBT3999783.1 exodeoxyribonuclease VII small subunit [Candidatus Neomarinimicrobiota bacterium]MBT4281838.1 exodeoxyribonuclease VII small subunit [Candidatus Neomarinimicrobiota bacterium]